ncbi:DUF6305 family protein [Dethiosulfovibrio salsuginis]|uniref:DUF6305 domain-containing protein n=1 Tax=Dethiosulfovibrio salsuginis TaxID=561720 RepID=A0A1X7KG32_9BACT|nr:DUF6305 family protein [Dethiosulfovibrio salsuginis]SMG40255.1 hypothetical protein SAMN06275492_12731 [Dethiosulfovibrio salsuginis]
MKLRVSALISALALVVAVASVSCAADVALTSIGQSPDAMMVKVVLKSLKITPDYEALMKATDLDGQKVLIAVVGGSSKGLGAAGIDKDQEVARSKALMEKAQADGMKILVMHVGGPGRRGTLSDLFISAAVPFSDALIVVDRDNTDMDGLFSKLVDGKVEILSAENVRGTKEPLGTVLSSWGVN